MKYKIAVGEKKFEVEIGVIKDGLAQVLVNNQTYEVNIENYAEVTGTEVIKQSRPIPVPSQAKAPVPPDITVSQETAPVSAPSADSGAVTAPISGRILEIKVKVGDTVSVGQELLVLEAMKMENSINSNISGKIRQIRVQAGDQVSTGDVLVFIE
jgi:biotin carboxyl carrier protein